MVLRHFPKTQKSLSTCNISFSTTTTQTKNMSTLLSLHQKPMDVQNQNISPKMSRGNEDEAKREFSLALHLHKSPSLLLSSGTNCSHHSNNIIYDHQFYFDKPKSNYEVYSLMEPMPLPEPVWSTTQPSILASNIDSSLDYYDSKYLLDLESFEFVDDHDQDQACSYTWWVGFLKSLDGKITSSNEVEECCYNKHCTNIKEYNYGCELEEETANVVTPVVVDVFSASDNKSLFGTTDEWLSFPSAPEDEDRENDNLYISP